MTSYTSTDTYVRTRYEGRSMCNATVSLIFNGPPVNLATQNSQEKIYLHIYLEKKLSITLCSEEMF